MSWLIWQHHGVKWHDPIRILWDFNKETICKGERSRDQGVVKCDHSKVGGEEVGTAAQRQKELLEREDSKVLMLSLEPRSQSLVSIPFLCFGQCSLRVVDLNRKPEAREALQCLSPPSVNSQD